MLGNGTAVRQMQFQTQRRECDMAERLRRTPPFQLTLATGLTFTQIQIDAAVDLFVGADPFAVAVRISATFAIFEVSSPNTLMLLDAISAASPSSVPVARARLRTAGTADRISFGFNPIRPIAVIPSATSLAV